jgi:SAM-dependent methyltransferase
MNRNRHPREVYSGDAEAFANRYESVSFEQVHGAWLHLLPPRSGLALDVGAGSGRDAAWLAARGWEVVAVEPAKGMREKARRLHESARIRWLDDALPALAETHRLDYSFDLILLSAVWMHVPTRQRERAFRKLANLLKPGGLFVFTLRHGEPDSGRAMHPVDGAELAGLGRKFALEAVALPKPETTDALGRPDVHWSTHVFRLPDDGTGALPLIRHIIINDPKSSTYKLALLRILVRIADGARGMILHRDDDRVTVPFGLVALYWLKVFKNLVGAGASITSVAASEAARLYPQQANPRVGLGFARDGFRALAHVSPVDFRIGARFSGSDASNLIRALRDICRNIRQMPAHYITLPGSDAPVFLAEPARVSKRRCTGLVLARDFLSAFGEFRIPTHIWESMSRYACWLEPAIVNEWCELMRAYDERRGVRRSMDDYMRALAWLEPERDTARVRERVGALMGEGRAVHCVWTGRRLRTAFEIDHCFPFACWPNNDLWNLLPASRRANLQKASRLPSAELLYGSRERILEWWREGYGGWGVLERFREEAFSSLPLSAMLAGHGGGVAGKTEVQNGVVGAGLWESVFCGVDSQRVRLRTDQRLEEWEG